MVLIAIDPGHGSNTYPPSKGVPGLPEHEFNAEVAIRIKKMLDYNGFKTFYTQAPHEKDIELNHRTNLANEKKADLFWSIHANFNGNSTVNGSCCFYWHTAKESKRLAEIWVRKMKEAGIKLHGSGIHPSVPKTWTNLHVVRETKMTALLTENGFMSNPNDLKRLQSSSYRDLVAETHAKAICEFFRVQYKSPNQDKQKEKKEEDKIVDKQSVTTPSKWAEDEWKEAVKNGYFDGKRPQEAITREEAAVVINRLRHNFLKRIVELEEKVKKIEEK
jgi:N-acetylmuramoyl-L-alanine amidase